MTKFFIQKLRKISFFHSHLNFSLPDKKQRHCPSGEEHPEEVAADGGEKNQIFQIAVRHSDVMVQKVVFLLCGGAVLRFVYHHSGTVGEA